MSAEVSEGFKEAEALKFKQKLENSEIKVVEENQSAPDLGAEDSDIDFALDTALETLDGLENAKAGKGDLQEAIAFADAQLPVLYRIYEKMPGDDTTPDRADLIRKIREITEMAADLADKSDDQGVDEIEAQIAKM